MPRLFSTADVFRLVKKGVFDKKKLLAKRKMLLDSAALQHWFDQAVNVSCCVLRNKSKHYCLMWPAPVAPSPFKIDMQQPYES